MDFKGQALAERIYQFLLLIFAVLGFLGGYYLQSFRVTMYFMGVGCVIACCVCLPDWPVFNRHPLAWLPAQTSFKSALADIASQTSSTPKTKKQTKKN